VAEQTRQAIANCKAALAACGATLDDVVRAAVYLTDLTERGEMDAVFAETWPVDPPARTTIGCMLSPGVKVEVELVAWLTEQPAPL
jgi:2-iminobutanoate/2-iminopropanoate deaminase